MLESVAGKKMEKMKTQLGQSDSLTENSLTNAAETSISLHNSAQIRPAKKVSTSEP